MRDVRPALGAGETGGRDAVRAGERVKVDYYDPEMDDDDDVYRAEW